MESSIANDHSYYYCDNTRNSIDRKIFLNLESNDTNI